MINVDSIFPHNLLIASLRRSNCEFQSQNGGDVLLVTIANLHLYKRKSVCKMMMFENTEFR
jgi:hypothetical protein